MNGHQSRRSFIAGLAMGTAGLTAAPYVLAKSKSPLPRSNRIVKIGIVGEDLVRLFNGTNTRTAKSMRYAIYAKTAVRG